MLIRKIGDFYLLSSVQTYLLSSVQTHLLSKKHKVSEKNRKYSENIEKIFDRGCMYMDEKMSQPVNKRFNEVLKYTNIKDVVDVFFTKEQILRNNPNLRLPKLLKTLRSYEGQRQRGGNSGTVKYLSSDERRNVLTYEYKEQIEQKSFVIKIAKDDHYSCAYKDESKIYEILCMWNGMECTNIKKHNDVIRYYGSGEVQKNEQNGIYISINQKDIILNNMKDELIGKHYLVLENTDTQEFVDFSEYLKTNNNENCVIVFNKIMQTIKKKKDYYGFFHGDLHADNVKVKAIEQNNDDSYSFNNVNNAIQEEHIEIKLFDFDFSGFLPTDGGGGGSGKISRNILIYKLTHDNNKLFTDNTQMNDKCDNNVTINTQKQKGDIQRFMFAFDYFRLLFSMILVFESKLEKFNLNNYRAYIDKDDVEIYNIIINWYNIQVEQPQWKLCFRDNYFFESIFKYTFTDKLTNNAPLVCRKQQQHHISQNNPSTNNISQVLAGLKITSTDQSSDFDSDIKSDEKSGGKRKRIVRKRIVRKKK